MAWFGKNLEKDIEPQQQHSDALCAFGPLGARSRAHCLPLFPRDHQPPARSEQASRKAARTPEVLGAAPQSRSLIACRRFLLLRKPHIGLGVSSGPPLLTPSAALPSRMSLSPGGGITRWQSDSAAPATRSKAGKYLALAPIENWLDSMRVNESIRSGNSREARPGEAPPAGRIGLLCLCSRTRTLPCAVYFLPCPSAH